MSTIEVIKFVGPIRVNYETFQQPESKFWCKGSSEYSAEMSGILEKAFKAALAARKETVGDFVKVKEVIKDAESRGKFATEAEALIDEFQYQVNKVLILEGDVKECGEVVSHSAFVHQESSIRSQLRKHRGTQQGSSYDVPKRGELVPIVDLESGGSVSTDSVHQSLYWGCTPFSAPGTRQFARICVSAAVKDVATARSLSRDKSLGGEFPKTITESASSSGSGGKSAMKSAMKSMKVGVKKGIAGAPAKKGKAGVVKLVMKKGKAMKAK